MRPIPMFDIPVFGLPLFGAVLLLAGCATATGSAAPPSTPASVAAPAPARASGPPPHGCATPAAAITVTDADNNGVVCMTAGGRLTLTLAGHGWTTPATDTAVLKPAGANAFTAAIPGKTTLTSSRPACPTGTVTCHARQAFQVRIVVN